MRYVEKRMNLSWHLIARRLGQYPTLRSIQIVLLSWFKVDEEPAWTATLIRQVASHFEAFNVHYCMYSVPILSVLSYSVYRYWEHLISLRNFRRRESVVSFGMMSYLGFVSPV